MTAHSFFHGTFAIRRSWAASPARIFKAWSDPDVKSQWFTGPSERWTLLRRSMDFTVGGTEVLEGRFIQNGMTTLYAARFHLIEPDRRLVYAYDLYHSETFHSVTLSSLLLEPEEQGTAVTYTEQIVFLDGQDGTESRRHGTNLQFDMIENALRLNGPLQ